MPLAPPVIKIVLLVSFIIKYLGGQSARERRCGLDSKPFITDSRRSARDERPRSELSFIKCYFHCAVPFCRLHLLLGSGIHSAIYGKIRSSDVGRLRTGDKRDHGSDLIDATEAV